MDPVVDDWLVLCLNSEYLLDFGQFRVGCDLFDAADFAGKNRNQIMRCIKNIKCTLLTFSILPPEHSDVC